MRKKAFLQEEAEGSNALSRSPKLNEPFLDAGPSGSAEKRDKNVKLDAHKNYQEKRNPRAVMPACPALSCPGGRAPVNGSITNLQPTPVGNIPTATVEVEPAVSSVVSGTVFPHLPSAPRRALQRVPSLQTSSPFSTSQERILDAEDFQDMEMEPMVSQFLRPRGQVNTLNNPSRAWQAMSSAPLPLLGGTSRELQSMGGTHMVVSNMICRETASSVPAARTVFSSGQSEQSGNQTMTGSSTLTGTAQVAQNSGPSSFSQVTSNISGNNSNLAISQLMSNIQGGVIMGQVSRISQGNSSGTQMVQSENDMRQNRMATSDPPSSGTMMPTWGMSEQAQSWMQPRGGSGSVANMQLPPQTSSALQSAQPKYVKVWEGNLFAQRHGEPVFITRLEGYRNASASETLAANWPSTMQILRLVCQDHINSEQYVGEVDFLVFQAIYQDGFLGKLQEKKLCAVVQLPSQILLLYVSDEACRLIGMLVPLEMVILEPQISSHPQQQQLQQQQRHHRTQPQEHQIHPTQQEVPQLQQQHHHLVQPQEHQIHPTQQEVPQLQQQQQQQLWRYLTQQMQLKQLPQLLQRQLQEQQQQILQFGKPQQPQLQLQQKLLQIQPEQQLVRQPQQLLPQMHTQYQLPPLQQQLPQLQQQKRTGGAGLVDMPGGGFMS